MANTKRRATTIGAIVMVAIIIVIAAVIFFMRGGSDGLENIDLSEYVLVEADFGDDEFYVNEPLPEGTLLFRNGDGEEKKARTDEEGVTIAGYDAERVGNGKMTVTVKGEQSLEVPYTVVYKEISCNKSGLCLSLKDPFELERIFVRCTDYYDRTVARVPLVEIAREGDFDTEFVSDIQKTAYLSYMSEDISVDYTVGYIGYGNYYRGTRAASDGVDSYVLTEFCLDAPEIGEDSGSGYIVFGTSEAGWTDDRYISDLIWEKDPFDDSLTLSASDEYGTFPMGRYDCATHTLHIDADAFGTLRELRFTLELDAIPL